MDTRSEIALFERRKVRRVWHRKEWWFVIVDVVAVLSDSGDPAGYLKDMRRRDNEINKGWGQIATPLLAKTPGGKQKINCANTEGILRIIQSMPSPKAEPFKQWLVRIGKERIDEINNPELAMERMRLLYEKKGYPKEWVEKRARGIAVRQDLTFEWQNRGVEHSREFAILTNEIMQGAFDMKVGEYKKYKGLKKENLRDHMNDIELILTMLAEATTTKLTKDRDSVGFTPLERDAKEGGAIAGNTRREIERASGNKVISRQNYLPNRRRLSGKNKLS